ncbi:MAG: twin-arginine translocase subunit TatC [Candidatus Dormibacteraeota bacterium]|uniref:Sec-independent protein translocase protein TatC n=1 Tax=Candidatus Aeolococcus gillhamiae TaxID=3127015 RepID=A0A2W5YX98_9BACT|nr:twin-arginine translocase subunit TatC [Candidatus Dormibacteraeota bacterium]PZR77569.1 MAG: twin-arginine translocase subunit TatC [Candidatus Dormibacter sp. RRmetagenome_bin12]
MTIVQHLEELRRVLMISAIAWIVATVVAFVFHGAIFEFLLTPLTTVLGRTNNHITSTAIFTSPTEGLTIPMKISAIAGLIGAMPVILWQVWGFVAPGLQPLEKRFVGPFIASAFLLFAGGASFAYFVMPIGLNFLATFLGSSAVYLPDINSYLSFLLLLIIAFGVTFELPVVVILLGVLGIVSSKTLRQKRKFIWVGIIAAALVVTPGADPYTPTALFIPLIIFFEVSVLILAKALKR